MPRLSAWRLERIPASGRGTGRGYRIPKAYKMPFLSIRWLLRKIFGVNSSNCDALSNADYRGLLAKRDDNGTSIHDSRGEKARRKAEEKRQAKLEKELLEQEKRAKRRFKDWWKNEGD
ncbi:hypothetical protein F3Y22_tig00110450pilonHSYRG00193 [Hibiscus syriacus]|uniref:Uncharacterized protein n=1 Tax=Hibiscus syriacus TaxID=106335 RepID=A0A6A3ANE8_HIBSY|nr:hypothetical protein F3Y22_tig00110450pilonHSYRG00193 [Hibiscus syriacus]